METANQTQICSLSQFRSAETQTCSELQQNGGRRLSTWSDDEPDTPKIIRDELKNPAWIEHKAVGEGPVQFLNPNELEFWKQLIKVGGY